MGGNILTAIQAIVNRSSLKVTENRQENIQNRANQMGAALEDYVKDAFANCLGQDYQSIRQAHNETFSYIGNNTNPPDAILTNSDAIEIKKIKTIGAAQLQLNSSYPKNKLRRDNPKICKACRDCEEDWEEKDMLYVVGAVENEELQDIFFVYGDLYCDTHEIYERVENAIKDGIKLIEEVTVAETGELARINKVDHLGISDLRVRGMWLIDTPFQLFKDLTKEIKGYTFKLTALIPKYKYDEFENTDEFEKFCLKNRVSISDKKITDPKNPAKYINSKLIVYYY